MGGPTYQISWRGIKFLGGQKFFSLGGDKISRGDQPTKHYDNRGLQNIGVISALTLGKQSITICGTFDTSDDNRSIKSKTVNL